MAPLSATQREVLFAELDLHKAEFAALRDEYSQSIAAERQSLNLCLVAASAALGVMPFITAPNALVVLLLLPLVFHVLLWEMLSALRSVGRISNYLTTVLIPHVNSIFDELGSKPQDSVVLGWETHVATMPVRKRDLLMASLTPTMHWMPILAIAALLIGYVVLNRNFGRTPSPGELVLILLNLALLVWAAVRNAVTARAAMRQARLLRQASGQSQTALEGTRAAGDVATDR